MHDPHSYPFPSRRTVVFACGGMVATSQHLAAEAGLDAIKRGGNAIDAAVAAASCLTVVEPTSNGVGGDAFAIVCFGGRLYGLNSSGPAPGSASIEALRRRGYSSMPLRGFLPVTVPGIPAAWAALTSRFGRLSLSENLKPAVEYAEGGYPVSPVVAGSWSRAFADFSEECRGPEFEPWFSAFAPEGRAPLAGELFSCPQLAETLAEIGETGSRSFYEGRIAERIGEVSASYGGLLSGKDLARFSPSWVSPLTVPYHGYTIAELPPNGQGIVALMALNLLGGLGYPKGDPISDAHLLIESLKRAFADGLSCVTDPERMRLSPEALLSESHTLRMLADIGETALDPASVRPYPGGTVYLCTADREGNMVSYIQSNYTGFGSGLVVPGTGIALHNRGNTFSLDPNHANALEPGKRTYHTIIPGFILKGGRPLGPFGVMGAFMQPQGHVQLLSGLIDRGLNPQAALDAPRFRWVEGMTIEVERFFPESVARGLEKRGHEIRFVDGEGSFGRGQIILRNEGGVFEGATDPRADGAVAAF